MGANIAHHVVARCDDMEEESPMKVSKVILLHLFFSEKECRQLECECADDEFLNLDLN